MGNKAAAKRLMVAAGVPCVPGYHGVDQSDATLTQEARRIGFPVMVKAAAGGGGRGMRLVGDPGLLAQALSGARSEAKNAFGSDELILEKAVADARHVEIQVFGDAAGNMLHLGERDCSLQRRHQKLVEEAPSPAVSPELRARMGAAAVAAAQAVGYRGAGTVEFLLAPDGEFYFLEMNTRLQVEHPVTEAVTGLDLVALQLRVAAGELLPLRQEQVHLHGHAIEARLCAEDPHRDFLPRSGTVHAWLPPQGEGVRVDHGLQSGQVVSPHYDSMLAKVIAHGENREEARRRLLAALSDVVVLGIPTNRAFLMAALRHPVYISGSAHTGFVGAHFAKGSPAMQRPAPEREMLALAAVFLSGAAGNGQGASGSSWRSDGVPSWPVRVDVNGTSLTGTVTSTAPERYSVTLAGDPVSLEIVSRDDGAVRFAVDGRQRTARFALAEGTLHLDLGGITAAFRDTLLERNLGEERDGDGRLLAPMNGRIVAVLAKAGERVAKGQRIVVLEAMKMQHEITAGRAGVIESVAVREGEQVATRQLLAALAKE
jgi:geranyl-CoA carboxylase alpha subunit